MITTKQAAKLTGLSVKTIQSDIRRGNLPAEKIGRDWHINPADLDRVRDRKPGRPKMKQYGEKMNSWICEIDWASLGMPKYDTYHIINNTLYGQNISTHPCKERTYQSVKICDLTDKDIAGLKRLAEKNRAAADKQAAEKQAIACAYEAWLATLPATVSVPWEWDGKSGVSVYQIHTDTREITDEYGNFYLPLPSEPVANLAEWVAANDYVPE